MSSRTLSILAVAVFAMAAFAGITICGDGVDAEDPAPITSISYKVGENTYVIPLTNAERTAGSVTLKTLAELGATADTGMSFKSWKSGTTNYTAGSTFVTTGLTDPVELIAEFTPITYTATFQNDDGTVLKTVTGAIRNAAGETITPVKLSTQAPADPSKEGYIFAGWLATGAEQAVKKADLGSLTADITFTAVYTVDYKITFVDGDKTFISKVSQLTVPDLGDRTGFVFLGWFIGTEQVNPNTYVYEADTTLTAKWEPVNCFVTFVAGSYSKEVAVLYGETVIEPALPEGYSGWDFDFSTPITKDITIKAIEKPADKPTGLSDPMVAIGAAIAGLIVMVILAVVILKRDSIRAGMVKRLDVKKDDKEDKKE